MKRKLYQNATNGAESLKEHHLVNISNFEVEALIDTKDGAKHAAQIGTQESSASIVSEYNFSYLEVKSFATSAALIVAASSAPSSECEFQERPTKRRRIASGNNSCSNDKNMNIDENKDDSKAMHLNVNKDMNNDVNMDVNNDTIKHNKDESKDEKLDKDIKNDNVDITRDRKDLRKKLKNGHKDKQKEKRKNKPKKNIDLKMDTKKDKSKGKSKRKNKVQVKDHMHATEMNSSTSTSIVNTQAKLEESFETSFEDALVDSDSRNLAPTCKNQNVTKISETKKSNTLKKPSVGEKNSKSRPQKNKIRPLKTEEKKLTRPRRAGALYSYTAYNEEKPLVCTWESIAENEQLLLETFKSSKYVVFFTGSGISKKAGLSTYREPDGIYERIKRKEQDKNQLFFDEKRIYLPTRTHMAISKLIELNQAKFVITQNCDNLHEKSGVPWENIIELHGNMYLQKCNSCHAIFEMDEVQRQPIFVHHKDISKQDHNDRILHGQVCYNCGKVDTLEHTITNFGEQIEPDRWNIAHEQVEKADLVIVLGSSCAVSPANTLPIKGDKLIICNLSSTPLDYDADFICKGISADQFMEHLLHAVGEEIPSYNFQLNVNFELCGDEDEEQVQGNQSNTVEQNSKMDEMDRNNSMNCDLPKKGVKSHFTVTNLDDIVHIIERIDVHTGQEIFTLSHDNDFDIELTLSDDNSISFTEFTIHLLEISQLRESSRKACIAGETLHLGESLKLVISCAIHEENSHFQLVNKEKEYS